jgi:phospholipid/cholesterol/gamma-HCH transport system permease protein
MTARRPGSSAAAAAAGFVGHRVLDSVLAPLGRATIFLGRTARSLMPRSLRFADIVYQIQSLGVRSLGLVVTMAGFAGMVMAFQFGMGLERFGAKLYIGQTTVTGLVRELGPVMTALIGGGRIGAGIAAELGGMAVTEQIDAVRALGADPTARLVSPRLLAVALTMPLLTVVADACGFLGSMLVAQLQYGVSPRLFVSGVYSFVTIGDFVSGLVKSVAFGLIIGVVACESGMQASGGTEGVGRATTHAVVTSALLVLGADVLFTKLLLGV